MAPRYTVVVTRVVGSFKERMAPLHQEGTEEPEHLAAWYARQYPDCRIQVRDEYAGDLLWAKEPGQAGRLC